MLHLLSAYGLFVLLGLSLGAYGWLAVAYGLAFRFSRRFIHLQQALTWLGVGVVSLLMLYLLRESGGLSWERVALRGGITLLPAVALWQRWSGRVNEPGYATARELLALRKPYAHPAGGDNANGLFVPSASAPDIRPLFRWRSLLGGLGVLASSAVILWLLSVFGF